MKKIILSVFFAGYALTANEIKTFQSGKQQVALLELFSSEGCNSCPPAEKSLYSLRDSSKLWKTFVPINFHVDYWNRLGWNDRFSKEQFTKRQRHYSDMWESTQVYTPNFVLNGKNAGTRLPTEINFEKPNLAGEIKVSVVGADKFTVEYSPSAIATKRYDVNFAILGNGLESKVTAGENKGEHLRHNFIVLHLETLEAKEDKKAKTFTAEFTKPTVSTEAKTLSVAAWVSEHDTLTPIQAVGGDLP